ncbi:MAG: hypothetical protein K2J13_02750 [Clostridia bacterium]|nr:hypothetical protein [Clostridia bacterium]
MKKKLVAVVALVLIVVLACSLAACNNSKSMFDGKFKKEASKEEAASFWKTAQTAFGAENEELATASDEDTALVKGWKGMKVSMVADSNYSSVKDDKKTERIYKLDVNGSLLFDGSATAITVKVDSSATDDDKTESKTMIASNYVKDKTMYASLGNGEKELNVKFGTDLGLIGSLLQNMVGGIAETYSETVVDALAEAVLDMDYDAIVEHYEGFKAYVDNSGKYNRIKYVLTAEMVADFNDENEDFVKNATFGECSIIIVTDKDGVFQGMKFETNTSITVENDGSSITMSTKSAVSMEKCDEITSYPANLDDYKDVKDLKMEDLEGFDFN